MEQKVRGQTEVCPWCGDKIYVFPGRHQPCPSCAKHINVHADKWPGKTTILHQLYGAFDAARSELEELEKALSENLEVNTKTLEFSRERLKRLQDELKIRKEEI